MPSIPKPTLKFDRVEIGTYTGTYTNPTILLKIGTEYYTGNYTQTYPGGIRQFYGTIDTTTKKVYLDCASIAATSDLQEIALTNIEVLIGNWEN